MDDKWLLLLFIAVFLFFYIVPQEGAVEKAILGGLVMTQDYARMHVLTCLVPAFFIAGAITTLLKKDIVLKYLGAKANKAVAYVVASVSGAILTVCSCTVLPLFAGIWKRGAGLGPATTFLYSGPAINIAAIFLTASVLGFQLGVARIVAAVALAIIIGIAMELMFRNEKGNQNTELMKETNNHISIMLACLFIFVQILGLIINGLQIERELKFAGFAVIIAAVAYMAVFKLTKEQREEWLSETWSLSKGLLPVLFVGVFMAGAIGAVLPQQAVEQFVGGNSLETNFFASIAGAFTYFATLTEVPIIQALMAKGMGHGPALALLLAGPSLSLPAMLVIHKILGTKKTVVYVVLVIFCSTVAGMIYGSLF